MRFPRTTGRPPADGDEPDRFRCDMRVLTAAVLASTVGAGLLCAFAIPISHWR